ncbi:hypothetical protein [Dyella sp. 2RAB6]|uniref:hypothetical protein n=1 Tax=Dyella sp. 2RAB6 TaxID=3232992 RepID=UPI003F93ADA8
MHTVTSIHSKQDYEDVLREASSYFENEPEPGFVEGQRFEMLMSLIEDYEVSEFDSASAHKAAQT